MAKIKVKAQSAQYIDQFDVETVDELNFFDLSGEKAKTVGSSNKMYHAELHFSKDRKKAQIMTMFGPTGQVLRKDYRYYCENGDADNGIGNISLVHQEYKALIASKRKKGYKDIDVAQRTIGTDDAKKITKTVQLKNAAIVNNDSSLHPETNRIISSLMGSTNDWVITTLKCPLGQLTNDQIDKGRLCLEEAKKLVNISGVEKQVLDITNQFYSLIPHNLGSGSRGKMEHLLLNSNDKINQKEYDLDTLLDAKAIGATLVSNSVYDQYKSLDTDFNYIDKNNLLFSWLNSMIQDTRANNHRQLGKIVLLNAWDIQRKYERDTFTARAKVIAKECGKQVIPEQMNKLVRARADVPDHDLYKNANVIPLFHGSRTQNITGILKKGLLIRPSGVVITGSMYDSSGAIYKSANSTKSINYTSINSSYWSKGTDDRAFLFISDCALGRQLMARGPYGYNLKNISPNHSVWAKGGFGGVINDEMILYRTDQHNLRYLLEFTCK